MSHSVTLNHDLSEPHSKSIGISIILTAIILVLIGISTVYYYEGTLAEELNSKENEHGAIASLQEVRDYEHLMLNSKKELDSEKGTYQIPIQEAMDKVIERYRTLQK